MSDTQWLFDRLKSFGEREAICTPRETCTYNNLVERTDRWIEYFEKESIPRGAVISLEGNWSPATAALCLAIIRHDGIYVPIGAASARERRRFKEIARVQVEFEFSGEGAWEMRNPHRPATNDLLADFCANPRPGLVLFSSGSTGEAKGVLHDLDKVLDKYRTPRPAMRTIIFLAFDHIGGVNTFFHILSNGGTLIVPPGRNPGEVCRTIEQSKAELLPTSPSFLNLLLLSREYENFDLSSIKVITYGTEMMSDKTLAEMVRLFPQVRLQQTYGLSEVGILRSKSMSSDSKFVKIGGEGYQTKIVDGILWIKADAAMIGYLNAPNPFDADRWLCTGDMVEQDGEYIKFLGRKTDIINVGGEKVFPAEVENVLLEMPEVRDVTVVGEPHPMVGNMVVARVTPMDPAETAVSLKQKIRRHCKDRLAAFKIPSKVEMMAEDQFNYRYKKTRQGGIKKNENE